MKKQYQVFVNGQGDKVFCTFKQADERRKELRCVSFSEPFIVVSEVK